VSATKRRVKNEFHSVKIGSGPAEKIIGVSGPQFSLLAKAAGQGCIVVKNVNDKELGVLHRMGLVRFTFPQKAADAWPDTVAVLTPAGAQALAQEPFGHAASSATVQ
jgi:hypothetical protein